MPDLTPRGQAEAQARREREAAALRDNLRRRKTQMRAQEDCATQQPPEPPFCLTTDVLKTDA